VRSVTIQRLDNPSREIDVDSLLFLINAASRGQVQVINNVFLTFLKSFVEVFSFHRAQPLLAVIFARTGVPGTVGEADSRFAQAVVS
jgi:hypothetical protein